MSIERWTTLILLNGGRKMQSINIWKQNDKPQIHRILQLHVLHMSKHIKWSHIETDINTEINSDLPYWCLAWGWVTKSWNNRNYRYIIENFHPTFKWFRYATKAHNLLKPRLKHKSRYINFISIWLSLT